MSKQPNSRVSRRTFCQTAGAAALGAWAAPASVRADDHSAEPFVTGVGDYRYKVDHQWAQLPDKYNWQTTHNVAVDSQGHVYVIHEGRLSQPDHPAIMVFDPDGKFVRAFGEQFQGGGHGLEVQREAGDEFLYVCAYKEQRSFAKLSLTGEEIWRKGAPMETGYYTKGEETFPRPNGDDPWGRDRFQPTNFAMHPDGGFFLADGYGAWRIHYFDASGQWVRSFGEPSAGKNRKQPGHFSLPHGLWVDNRGDEPLVAVADRQNHRLQWFTLEGEHKQTLDGFVLPANVDVHGDLMLVPELAGRVTLLDRENKVITRLCDDHDRIAADSKRAVRGNESMWLEGKFIHPHDACFDAEGNIYVAEWVHRGRVTKLTRLS